MRYLIASTVDHGARVRELRLAPPPGQALPAWEPGAHLELSFSARSGRTFSNAYSIVGEVDGMLRIAVQREDAGRGGSRVLHQEYQAGMVLEAAGPLARFRLHRGAVRTVLIAGGIGITPLLPMARALDAAGADYTLHLVARDSSRLVLDQDRRALGARVRTWLTATQGRPDLAGLIQPWQEGCELHACGPAGLLEAVRATARALGWPPAHVHVERFGTPRHEDDRPLRVHLRRSGLTLDVKPGASILDALLDAGAFLSYDCRRGECGHCYAAVTAGEAKHRDSCLGPAQRAAGMTPCVSWARGPLLELDI